MIFANRSWCLQHTKGNRMDQLVILIIIYIIYLLFNALVKKAKGQQKPPVKRPPPRSTTVSPPVSQPRPSQPVGEAAPGLELPPFLREMFGLEKPQPEPLPEKKEPPGVAEKPEEPLMPDVSERIPPSAKMYADEVEDLSKPFPTGRKRSFSEIRGLLSDRESIRDAFILKEILDRPVSKRERRFPFTGMM
jgi:hypothetical protein